MNTSCELNVFHLERVCRTCGRAYRNRFRFDQIFGNENKSVFELLSILQLNIQMEDGLPQQICLGCCKFIFEIHKFRNRCVNAQKKFQADFSSVQKKIVENNHKHDKPIPQTDTKIQQPENSNENSIPDIKEEQITDDSEMAIPTPSRVANSDDGQNTRPSAVVKSESLDNDSEMSEVGTATISKDLENTISAIKVIKEEAIADIYKPIPESIIASSTADGKISTPLDSRVAEDDIKVEDSDNDKDDSRNVLLGGDSSGLESDEEHYDEKIKNWQCEYYFDEAQMKRTCNLCNEKFFYYENHLEMCPKYNVKTCKYCTFYFRTATDLEDHIKQMHEGWMLCSICSRPFTDYNTLLEHVESHSTRQYVTCNCNMTFKNPENRFDERIFNKICYICSLRCDICGDNFRHPHMLKIHKLWHRSHAEPKKKFSCVFCKKEFLRKANLDKHLKSLSGCIAKIYNYRCSKCSKAFLKINEALEHFKTHNTTCKRIRCLKCNLHFRVSDNLYVHHRVCYGRYDRPEKKAEKNIYRKVSKNTVRKRRRLSLSQSAISSPLENKKMNKESFEIDVKHEESSNQKGGSVDGNSDKPNADDDTVEVYIICS